MFSPSSPAPLTTASALSPTLATIRLPAVAHNLRELRRILAPQTEILAVIKADGYGHGCRAMAEALSQLGIRRLGVATVQEGIVLREAGILGDIIVMGGIFPWQVKDSRSFQPDSYALRYRHGRCPESRNFTRDGPPTLCTSKWIQE